MLAGRFSVLPGLVAGLCLVAPAAARADLTVTLRVASAKGQEIGRRTVAFGVNRLRIDEGGGSLVVDLTRGIIRLVEPGTGKVRELAQAEHLRRLQQSEAAYRRATGRGWAEGLASTSPYRAQVTTARRKILGHDVVRVDLTRDGKPLLEAWCAPALSTKPLLDISRALSRGPLSPAWGGDALVALLGAGFPLSVRDVPSGQRAEAVSVSLDPLNDARLAAPASGRRQPGRTP